MMTSHRFLVAVALVVSPALPLAAQDIPASIRTLVACAPQATTGSGPSDAPRIIGSQDTATRGVYEARDLIVIDTGTGRGIQLGQKFAVRRVFRTGYSARTAPKVVVTAGWVTIVAVNEGTAIASIDFTCDSFDRGDYLEAWTEPVIPGDVNRTDAGGELDFSAPGRVLFGNNGRTVAGAGDLVLADVGQGQGVAPGARFAIYRDVHVDGVPLTSVGEAIVISVSDSTSLVRLTRARDGVQSGDLMIPRKR